MIPTPANIALTLANAWAPLTSEFLSDDFHGIFGVELPEPKWIDRLFIGLSNSGDFEKRLSSSECVRWWQVDDSGVHEIELPAFRFHRTEGVFERPVFNFFLSGNRVFLKEVLGNAYVIRRVGECVFEQGTWQLGFDCPGFG